MPKREPTARPSPTAHRRPCPASAWKRPCYTDAGGLAVSPFEIKDDQSVIPQDRAMISISKCVVSCTVCLVGFVWAQQPQAPEPGAAPLPALDQKVAQFTVSDSEIADALTDLGKQ